MSTFSRLLLVMALLFSANAGLAAAAGRGLHSAGDLPPTPAAPWGGDNRVFLPLVARPPLYQVSGRVLNSAGQALPDVTVQGGAGASAQTGSDGSYQLPVDSGALALAPYKDGYAFEPAMLDLNISQSVGGQNFTALAACTEAVTNGGFESSTWWTLLAGAGYYPSAYTTAVAHSGARSLRTGITNPLDQMTSESRVRSSAVSIPSSASSAMLRVWLYPQTSETVMTGSLDPSAARPQPPDNADLPTTAFGDMAMAADAQYVRLLDSSNAVLATLTQFRSNNQYWSLHQFDLSAYKGQTIKIEVGVYNDGFGGVTALYADDVSLQLCAGAPPPPPPTPTCSNLVSNSNFEYNGSWNLPDTPYPAGYSYDYYVSAYRSMRTGIPLYTSGTVESYSDAWQNVAVPSGSSARLKVYLFPRSEELYSRPAAETDAAALADLPALSKDAPLLPEGTLWNDQALAAYSTDLQYILVLNPYTGAIRQTLLWWTPYNASGWVYREFDLSAYAGQTIRIQFGTYNNAYGGRSA
ncbi:MAG: hypothetical protein ACKOC5_10860, partial [Chloroflexota bacterium]